MLFPIPNAVVGGPLHFVLDVHIGRTPRRRIAQRRTSRSPGCAKSTTLISKTSTLTSSEVGACRFCIAARREFNVSVVVVVALVGTHFGRHLQSENLWFWSARAAPTCRQNCVTTKATTNTIDTLHCHRTTMRKLEAHTSLYRNVKSQGS